jgi:hypothetical protein
MKLNKLQKSIYDWLLSKNSYLKCSPKVVAKYYPKKASSKDIQIALEQARITVKQANLKPVTSLQQQLDIRNGVNAEELSNNLYKTKIENTKKSILKLDRNSYSLDNILVVADMHEPFCKKGYLEHCIAIRDKYKCGRIILIGDEVDLCGVSQWEKDPDGFSAGTEAELAQAKMKAWYAAFPTAFVCIGNHTARPFRQAKSNGVPKKFMKTYEEAWEAPSTWKWADSWEFNNIHFTHGTGHSGPNAAIKIATRHRQSTVIGHIHSEAGIQYSASKIDLVWGMQVGGALCDKSYAAHYAKDQIKKSIVGCGVILDGKIPLYEPMIL